MNGLELVCLIAAGAIIVFARRLGIGVGASRRRQGRWGPPTHPLPADDGKGSKETRYSVFE